MDLITLGIWILFIVMPLIYVIKMFVDKMKYDFRKDQEDIWECAICHNWFKGYGNNPEPVASGSCCDTCNSIHVIPARLRALHQNKKNELD